MPRNGSGTYTLPQAPFTPLTVISSSAVNSNFSDIATALTGSLPRDGQAGMLGQFQAASGSVGAPSITFNSDSTTGFSYSSSTIPVSIAGVSVGSFASTGWTGSVIGAAPVGMIVNFSGSSIPALWYQCYGQPVNRSTYSALFAVIGTTYGSGNGTTTFNLPDLRGVVVAGLTNMGGSTASTLTSTYYGANPTALGTAGGGQSHVMTTNELVLHGHVSSTSDSGHTHSTQGDSGTTAFAGTLPGGNPNYGETLTSSTGFSVISNQTTSSTGSSSAFTLVQPTIMVNKIIYAGV
jgi:microcystin-dependent protein